MKRIVILLILAVSFLYGEGIHWEKDYRSAVTQATSLQRPIFFVFSNHNCKWCRHLEATTFKDAEVIKRLNRDYVNVIAYTDANDFIPRELWVPGTPALWFLDSSGEAMFQPIQGAIGPSDLLEALEIVSQEFEKEMIRRKYGNKKE